MTQINVNGTGELDALDSVGNVVMAELNKGLKLAVGTYFVALRTTDSLCESVQLVFDGTIAGTATFETTNLARTSAANSGAVSDFDTTAGNWIQENPTSGVYVGGTGFTLSNLTITISGGGTAGGAMVHLGNLGTKRLRTKLVITTPGFLRCAVLGKD